MRRAALTAIVTGLVGCAAPGSAGPAVPVEAVVEESDDETLAWVSEVHGLASLHGRVVDLDLILAPTAPDGSRSGVRRGGREIRCTASGPVSGGEGAYQVSVPAVAQIELAIVSQTSPTCVHRQEGLAVRFSGAYRVVRVGDGLPAQVRLTQTR